MTTSAHKPAAGMSEHNMTAADVQAAHGVDLVTAETLRNGFIEVTRQMHTTLQRSAFNAAIRDAMDFGVCLHVINDDGSTDLVAVTEGCTQFAFTHQHMTNMVLDEYGLENLGPGDMLVCNDAFRGGIHNGDLNFFRVIFDDGRPVFVVSDAAHVFDVGGPGIGGLNPEATSLYEEGLRLPPMLAASGDALVRAVVNLLCDNTRSPMHMMGDLRALLGTLRTGEQRVRALIDRYGVDTLRGAAQYVLGLSERRMRAALAAVPDGDYVDEVFLDDDGRELSPIKVRLTARVRGSRAELDFSGSARQTLGASSTGWQEAARSIIGPKVMLDPNHPMNAGAMRPFDVLLPPGSVVLALPPAPTSDHTQIGSKIATLSIQVMSEAVPERAVAADSANCSVMLMFGVDDRPGREGNPYGQALVLGAGWGGTQECDGVSHCAGPMWNCRNPVTEYTERESAIVIWEYGRVMDTAGAGQFRGGFATYYVVEAVSPTTIIPVMDAFRMAVPGLAGGWAGATGNAMLVDKGESDSVFAWNGVLPAERFTPLFGKFDEHGRPDPVDGEFGLGTRYQTSRKTLQLQPGEVIRYHMSGAAGYGNPLERDIEAVVNDVHNELITVEQAREAYGVVIDVATGGVDEPATAEQRQRLRGVPTPGQSAIREWPLTSEDARRFFEAQGVPAALIGKV